MALDALRKNDMMAHLLGALEQGQDIGHYGRLVFAMIARHFIDEQEVIAYLQEDPHFSEQEARALMRQVSSRGYNPPRRERILDWQSQQDFPICPNSADPDSCNVYKNLKFPTGVYEDIEQYHERKAAASKS